MNDLTRWNRAGKSRFRYVDGNAATFLDDLRATFEDRFEHWKAVDTVADPAQEQLAARLERVLLQYLGKASGSDRAKRGDWAFEIARSAARASHVLCDYLDAYANEGYLRTATQWENVRRLVEMLDYHPAPPASASTSLVLTAKEDAAGTVDAGLQAKYTPEDGGSPVIFEMLADLEIDAALNELHVVGWNRSVETFRVEVGGTDGVGGLPVIQIQGVGPVRSAALVAHGVIVIADLAGLEPPVPGLAIPATIQWEIVTRAQLVLSVAADVDTWGAVLDETLADVLDSDSEYLAEASGRSVADVNDLLEALRKVQLALDEAALETLTLADLGWTPDPPWIDTEGRDLSAGQVALVVTESGSAAVVNLESVDQDSGVLSLTDVSGPEWRDWTRGETTLRVSPVDVLTPRLNGPDVVTFDEPHGLSSRDVVAWQTGANWSVGTAIDTDEYGVRMRADSLPAAGTEVFHAHPITSSMGQIRFPNGYAAAFFRDSGSFVEIADSPADYTIDSEGDEGSFRILNSSLGVARIFLIPNESDPAGTTVETTPGEFVFDGSPGDLVGDEWVVVEGGTEPHALRVARITEGDGFFTATFHSEERPSSPVLEEDVTWIQGVDQHYKERLGVGSIKDLLALDLTTASLAMPENLAWEFQTRARLVRDFSFDATLFEPYIDRSVLDILNQSAESIADGSSASRQQAENLLAGLRLVQMSMDEVQLDQDLVLSDFVPAGGVIAMDGEEIDRITALHGPFEHEIHPVRWDRNLTPVEGTNLPIDPAGKSLPFLLEKGRVLLLEKENDGRDGFHDARTATIATVLPDSGEIVVENALSVEDGFTKGNLVIRGNVVTAGHGASKPQKVLGTGDSTRSNQSFVLATSHVSFVADATMPSGVRADVVTQVADRIWQQVAALRDSGPTDPHYQVDMTEDGYLHLRFGDGEHGQRLPSGSNNVRIRFRVGTGGLGNVAPGGLEKLPKPHYLLDAVRQPMQATGGNDLESMDSLKENAPASVLTMERAVSITDFARLAASQSSVWQANAFTLPSGMGRFQVVEVVVVPAGGTSLGDLGTSLEEFLNAHALPGVEVIVSEFDSITLSLEVVCQVKSAEYAPEDVAREVRETLLVKLSLENRRLGQDLYLSEIYGIVEGITGVENSTCVIAGDPATRVVRASEQEVIHLHADAPALTVETTEYGL